MARFVYTKAGTWRLGGLRITDAGLQTGEGAVPPGFRDWDQVERVIRGHSDFGRLLLEVPEVEKEILAEKEKLCKILGLEARGVSEHRCRWCGELFAEQDDLQWHLEQCEVLLKERESLRAAVAELADSEAPDAEAVQHVKPLTVPDAAAEIKATEEEKEIDRKQAEAEAAAIAERKVYMQKLTDRIQGKNKKTATKKTAKKEAKEKKEKEA